MHHTNRVFNSITTLQSNRALRQSMAIARKLEIKARRTIGSQFRILGILLIAATPMAASFADSKTNDTLLVHGNIAGGKNSPIEVTIDTLKALESSSFTTSAPWTNGPIKYTGVRINIFLKSIGALSTSFKAIASNEYQFLLKDVDFDKYPIIIAYEKNDEILTTRTLGPFLIMFPFDDFPELLNEKNKAASVWQLTEMEIL